RHRLLLQVIKRFASSAGHFCQQADAHSREMVRNGLLQLQKLFESTDPALANEVDHLIPQFGQVVAEKVDMPAPQIQSNSVSSQTEQLMPKVEIQHDSDRVWKQTLLKVAELLCENQPDDPIGYSLRRHAIWYTLKTAPLCKDGRITQLAAVSHDRVADYRTALVKAGLPLWQQIETSITLAPYWFDGHFLSAQIARQLGYSAVAESIRQSVQRVLEKIPALNAMTFSDGTPFIGDDTRQWLEEKQKNTEISAGSYENVWAQYRENGLSAALKQLENQQSREQEPREQFYNQLTIAQLLMEAGMTILSNQHFENLWRNSHGVTLAEWEPSLLSQLEEHVAERTVVTAEESVS
ncbi:MAG: type VI secretion system protein TssA, partial [Enterobacterales bacterium]|nr:type VI secretion system protein TssA [Enterobacterales bacterium]